LQEDLIDPTEEQRVRTLIAGTSDLNAAAENSDFAIETVDEDPEVKKDIFSLLDSYCPQHSLLASNTSGLNIFTIIDVHRFEKVVITHFFAPPHIIPLVEVVAGPHTAHETVDRVIQILRFLGKEPLLLKRYIPGFIVNRIQRAIAREAFSLVDQNVASIADVDRAVKRSLGIRLPSVGILQTYDFTGLDAYYKICQSNPIELSSSSGPPRIVKEKVERGELGVKTGKGLYSYSGKKPEEILQKRDVNYLRTLQTLNNIMPV